ncbi:hypothetical protein [Salegentibacter salegens]|uniref:Uncharacterized protein n=1 Tax=Salegentibacter salegens TaxID=143223 RepID=A0A1M7HHV0_9FLAO|nr:hypothetical protein [Salegentibacter salegens]PRX41361.1 hypothetical protein LY58_02964 [Salegentibacter salegens]SHM28075.1 hypothetical protein SAMN05878281_0144 [Salegentibacter salegens]
MTRKNKTYRIFYKLEEHLEIPMFLLALFWLYLFIAELVSGLTSTQEDLIIIIWILFIAEFLIKLVVAPRKLDFVKNNWITVIALIIPALRVFRIFYALRLLQSVRVINSTRIIRALTSGKRFFSALQEAQGPVPEKEMNVCFLITCGKKENEESVTDFGKQLIQDVKSELQESTGIKWFFNIEYAELDSRKPKRPSDFLDVASQRMAEGPYDMVSVITDVSLISRKNKTELGLSSSVARIMVLSTRKLLTAGRDEPTYKLNQNRVRYKAALLFLHLTGQILGLKKSSSRRKKIMGAKSFSEERNEIPSFNAEERKILKKKANTAPDRELKEGNVLESLVFHILMTFRHPASFFTPILRNWAIFLPLSLPGLATAAVAPALILIFTAETWDVGFGMTNVTAGLFAVISIMFASFYLVRIQSLFLPRREKRIITEHLAVANTVIYFSIFLACIGLFTMLTGLMLIIEIYVFPADLIQTWPTLKKQEITTIDKIRLAVFISTIGVTTGALAGGLESRTVIQHLALFRSKV